MAMDVARPAEDVPAHGVHGQYSDEEADDDGGATGQLVSHAQPAKMKRSETKHMTGTRSVINIATNK
jgi:hypothetical protein